MFDECIVLVFCNFALLIRQTYFASSLWIAYFTNRWSLCNLLMRLFTWWIVTQQIQIWKMNVTLIQDEKKKNYFWRKRKNDFLEKKMLLIVWVFRLALAVCSAFFCKHIFFVSLVSTFSNDGVGIFPIH